MEKILTVIILFISFTFSVSETFAASLTLSPATGKYYVGDTIVVGVHVQSSEQEMNAVSGVLSFPVDSLEVASLSKLGSVISLWVQEPSFSNTKGEVNFEGIVLSPGYKGAQGKILTVAFKVKKEGEGALGFSSGSILANDGSGTNILYDVKPSVLSFLPKPIVPKTEETKKTFKEKLDAQFGQSDELDTELQGHTESLVEPVGSLGVALSKYALLVVQPVLLTIIAGLNIFIFYKFFRMAHALHLKKPSVQRVKLVKYEDLISRQVSSFKKAKKHRHLSKEEEAFIKDFENIK
jgi:hypothetical protein